MDDKYIIAIEIGSSKIRGALASINPTEPINIIAVQEERVADSVRYGHVKNVEEVSTKIDNIRRKLENARAIQPRKITGVYVGLSGYTIAASLASETLRFDMDTDIDASSIERLKGLISTVEGNDKDIYELIPYEFIVDNESTTNPVGRVGRSIKGTFSVIAGSHVIKNNIKRVFTERLDMQINGYIVTALAQANMVLTPDEKQLGCMFVDFGCETTTIIIYKKGVLRYMVTLPMGSRNITRDLVSLNHLEEHAESIKRSIGIVTAGDNSMSGVHSIEQPEINNYISARAGEIIANVIANIEYAGLTPAELPSGIVTVGGGARLKGLGELITSQSGMKVRIGITPRNIRISDTSISADDISDIVALLLAAAERNPEECLSPIATTDYFGNNRAYDSADANRPDNGYDDGDDEENWSESVRIGEDFYEHAGQHEREEEYEEENRTNPIIERIKNKFNKIFRDDESDSFDD